MDDFAHSDLSTLQFFLTSVQHFNFLYDIVLVLWLEMSLFFCSLSLLINHVYSWRQAALVKKLR